MLQNSIIALAKKNNFQINDLEVENLAVYLTELEKWNNSMNLVGYKTALDILNYLVIDSFYIHSILQNLDFGQNIWDLGSGAGLPGIPLRILWQEKSYYLVEARQKRSLFMSSLLAKLALKNTFVINDRAEKFMHNKAASLIISKAFMPPYKLLDFIQNNLEAKAKIIMLNNEKLESYKNFNLIKTLNYKAQEKERFINILEYENNIRSI